MRRYVLPATVVLLALCSSAGAATISFLTDPFAGSTALTTPGRQVVGGEPQSTFDIATDVFEFSSSQFAINDILFANDVIGNVPASNVNVIVLQTLDDDGDPGTGFGAGSAANLIAAQITAPGAGFFVYFNSGLGLPRLVYSTDLSDNTADLKILFRMLNLAGQPGALPLFTDSNFAVAAVPEPGSLLLVTLGLCAYRLARQRQRV